ncbi:hypothetical protein HMPREF1624_02442 [Sporothrix schenckii ATCC 58251]|uniref:Glutaminase n=1 Tax=Sporothrix schenckii (strain ATCC 58251 / de Perez 2211183) TaxID=1391915 RepID=U7Q2F6_SPOS1|nr:hypothetical protein HMPREF1624_02442 [Sporothrix schenckii ATCC 58251]
MRPRHASSLALTAAYFGVAGANYLHSDGQDANGHSLPEYSPGRPPAIPLAVRSPYLSAWVTTAGNTTLNSNSVTFWSGIPLGWDGMVAVDNVTYEYLGTGAQSLQRITGLEPARPQSVHYDAHYSNFTFLAGPVEITASFFSPVTPKDICRTAIPMSYLTTRVRVLDDKPHVIRVYSDVNDAWIRRQRGSPLVWDLTQDNGTPAINGSVAGEQSGGGNETIGSASAPYTWTLQQSVPYFMAEDSDMAQWGNFTYSTAPFGARLSYENGDPVGVRYGFITQRQLPSVVQRDFASFTGRESVFAFAHDFGSIGGASDRRKEVSVRYSIGSIQTPAARYLYYGGVAQLRPWWHTCYGEDTASLVRFHWHDFETVSRLAAEMTASLKSDIAQYYEEEVDGWASSNNSTNGTVKATTRHALFPNTTVLTTTTVTSTSTGATAQPNATSTNTAQGYYIFDPDTAYGFLSTRDNTTGVAVPDVSEADALYAIVALSARQVMGSYIYAIPPSAPSSTSSVEPLMFQKEISSDGNLNSVDVIFPAAPFFLWANPEMLKYILTPVYEMQEGTFYPNSYCAHDIGAQFPNATGHVDGNDEYMPVEESGNFILLSLAYYRFANGNADSNATAWLASRYRLLRQFAQYLVDFSPVPAAQLSTDDFAGTLANQTNLAIKGILGIAAMGEIARIAGQPHDADHFETIARDYYRKWVYLAVDPTGHSHTLLAYQWRSSWGLLYNVFMDKLLDLGVVGDDIYAMQSEWYPQVSQVFGVPLDNRHHYTKSDWMMWVAATCTPKTRRLLVTSLAYWLNYTTTEHPFSDLFEVVGSGYYPQVPQDIRFQARPAVGGHFAILALARSRQLGNGNIDGHGNATGNATSEMALPTGASSDLSGNGSKTPPPTIVFVTGGTNTGTAMSLTSAVTSSKSPPTS